MLTATAITAARQVTSAGDVVAIIALAIVAYVVVVKWIGGFFQ